MVLIEGHVKSINDLEFPFFPNQDFTLEEREDFRFVMNETPDSSYCQNVRYYGFLRFAKPDLGRVGKICGVTQIFFRFSIQN